MRNPVRRFADSLNLRIILVSVAVAGITLVLFFWALGSLTPGLSPAEHAARTSSGSLRSILQDPVNLPHKLMQFSLVQSGLEERFWLRLPAVLLGISFLICFYTILRRWFGKLMAVYGIVLFASLPWVILVLRQATPDVLLLAPAAVLASFLWLSSRDEKGPPIVLFAVVCSLSLYVPGLIWFVMAAILLWHQQLAEEIQEAGLKWAGTSFIFAAILLVPLGIAVASDFDIIRKLLLVPASWPEPLAALNSIWQHMLALIWRTPADHPMILGTLPLLGVTHATLALFGAYAMWSRARAQVYVLLVLIFIAVVGAGVNAKLNLLSLALPSFGILFTAGLRYLFGEWRSVFPLNPFPKILALVLITALVLVNLTIGYRYALQAWPESSATKEIYVLQ